LIPGGTLVWLSDVGSARVVTLLEIGRAFAITIEKRKGYPVSTGTIKKVVSDRGFGFIAAEDGKEYFFHRNSLESSLDFDRLNGGEKVDFEIESSPKGPRAARV
jgi:CspA family cold shock protein